MSTRIPKAASDSQTGAIRLMDRGLRQDAEVAPDHLRFLRAGHCAHDRLLPGSLPFAAGPRRRGRNCGQRHLRRKLDADTAAIGGSLIGQQHLERRVRVRSLRRRRPFPSGRVPSPARSAVSCPASFASADRLACCSGAPLLIGEAALFLDSAGRQDRNSSRSLRRSSKVSCRPATAVCGGVPTLASCAPTVEPAEPGVWPRSAVATWPAPSRPPASGGRRALAWRLPVMSSAPRLSCCTTSRGACFAGPRRLPPVGPRACAEATARARLQACAGRRSGGSASALRRSKSGAIVRR